MIRNKEDRVGKKEIDITGPDGNAYCLLGYAKNLCEQLGKDYEKISKEMKSSDYENLINVFDREFGRCVDLVK